MTKNIEGEFAAFDISNSTYDIIAVSEDKMINVYDLLSGVNNNFKAETSPKHIKYYPVGNRLFTISCENFGLSVYDYERIQKIYSYKPEKINYHCFNNSRIVSACLDEGIKFFDLRCRYFTKFIKFKNCKKITWRENNFCAIGYNQILNGDLRNLKEENQLNINDLHDACIYKDKFCCLRKIKNEFYLELDGIPKKVLGNQIFVFKEKICTVFKDKIQVYTTNDFLKIKIEEMEECSEIIFDEIKNLFCIRDKSKIILKSINILDKLH